MPRWVWTVEQDSAERADRRIMDALAQELGQWIGSDDEAVVAPVLSRSRIQALMEDGKILFDGKPGPSRTKLVAGTNVELEVPDPEPLDLVPEDIPIEFLFQDEHLAVLNKPVGLTVHPSSTQRTGTLVHALLHHIKDLSGVGGVQRPGIVHRLDKHTSGALVIAKTDAAHRKLVEMFAAHDLERAYWALCYAVPRQTGRIETLIGRNPNDRVRMSAEVKEGKKAVTHIEVKERYGSKIHSPFASWVEARLDTGRTHQVRVHLTSLGASLFGDPLYGTPTSQQPKWKILPGPVQESVSRLSGQALHARVLGFTHPITGEKLRFEVDPPESFRQLKESLTEWS